MEDRLPRIPQGLTPLPLTLYPLLSKAWMGARMTTGFEYA